MLPFPGRKSDAEKLGEHAPKPPPRRLILLTVMLTLPLVWCMVTLHHPLTQKVLVEALKGFAGGAIIALIIWLLWG